MLPRLTPLLLASLALAVRSPAAEPVAIGSRLQLFVDNAVVERVGRGAALELHHPVPQEIALVTGESWEGNATNYVTVFRDGPIYRMYYRGSHFSYIGGNDRPDHRDLYCYAESPDGIHWVKPKLGINFWAGSNQNNIVLDGIGTHAFAPFRDPNPACAPDAVYKALAWSGPKKGLYAYRSTDALHWTLLSPDPVITRGAFDSLNLAFWDAARGEYREYHRDFREVSHVSDRILSGIEHGRDIRTSHSADFLHWTEPDFLGYEANVNPGRPAARGTPELPVPTGRISELYTNQVFPYYRAPDILLGFPTRYTDRGWTESAKALPRFDYREIRAQESRREGTAVTDGMFMSSRDREHFTIWPESFIRPGLRTHDSWFYGDTYQNWGLIETASALADAPPELSLYVTERTLQETAGIIRRYTLRVDGFVSLHAPLVGGELVTKALTFSGRQLILNASTSGAGSVRVEIQDDGGRALPGFALADSQEFYGDSLEGTASWNGGSDVSSLAGRPVRLRFVVRDADLYSFRTRN